MNHKALCARGKARCFMPGGLRLFLPSLMLFERMEAGAFGLVISNYAYMELHPLQRKTGFGKIFLDGMDCYRLSLCCAKILSYEWGEPLAMKIDLLLRPFLFTFLSAACMTLLSTASLASEPSALLDQLSGLASLDQKLQFLQANQMGGEASRAEIAIALINAASPDLRKETAARVLELLVTLNPRPADSAKFSARVVAGLREDVASEVASSIVLGAARGDASNLPKITVAVIVAQPSTVRNAAVIAGEVVVASPVTQASNIAAAIGAAFASNGRLTEAAPDIAASITRALLVKLSKGAEYSLVRREIADSVAALTVLLPGTWMSNRDLIVKIGKAVAEVIGKAQPGMATTIVGITSAAMRAAAGSSDITPILAGFREAFRNVDDPVIQQKLDQVFARINSGDGDKEVKPLGSQDEMPLHDDPLSQVMPLPASGGGYVVQPETNVVNR